MKKSPLSSPLSSVLEKMKKTFEASQKKLKASYQKEVEQIYKRNKKRPAVADNAKANDLNYHLFANALKKIGKPSDTAKVADKLRHMNADASKLFARNPKRFMQLMYSSASYLVEQGILSRKKLGHNYFEYSLKEWKHTKPSLPVKKTAQTRHKVAA